ncbi:MAG: methionyl-tRNA formyltransferase [Spirochaetes bacterium]|nr:methionyl-tRNA formyltransferase [Spirochaetota bacterium]
MKIIFLATSQIALLVFYSLLKNHDIKAVITQPDKPKGRTKELIPGPIAKAAEKENITLYKPNNIDSKLIQNLVKLDADIFITFAYGLILKKEFFSITKLGGINIHPSLLPKLRGPSPIRTAILQGLSKSGVTIQKMKLKVDSGDILYQQAFDILPEDDAVSIEEKVSSIAADIINPVLLKIEDKNIKLIPQNDSDVTFCKLFKKNDGLIDWNDKGKNIVNKIRALIKWPIAYSFIDNSRINIYKASINKNLSLNDFYNFENGKIIFADKTNGIIVKASDSLINIESLQQKGKKILDWKDFINGYRDLFLKKFE